MLLVQLTVAFAAVVVLALAGYLIGIAAALASARKSVAAIAKGLETVRTNTEPLPRQVPSVRDALTALLGELRSTDRQFGRIARLLKL